MSRWLVGFVQQQVIGLLREGAGHQHALLLAPGQGREDAVGEMPRADPPQRCGGDLVILERVALQGAPVR